LSLEGFKDLSALAGLEVGGAVSGLIRPDVALTRSGLEGPSGNLRRSSVPAFPRGTPPSGQLESITAGIWILSHLRPRTTSLIAVTAFGATTAANYAPSGLVDWSVALALIAGGLIGGLIGGVIAGRLTGRRDLLRFLFSTLVAAMALAMLSSTLN